jgi:hydrogenase 3 maturation protease
MKKKWVFTVGNGMMGDDAAGPLLANMIRLAPLADWEILNGGTAPENYIFQLRKFVPDQVLVVDATDMGLSPGEIRLVDEQRIDCDFWMTTHTLPLTFLMQSIREFVPKVDLVGIQPDIVAFGFPMSSSVQQAVETVYSRLKKDEWVWERL